MSSTLQKRNLNFTTGKEVRGALKPSEDNRSDGPWGNNPESATHVANNSQ